MRPVSAAFLRTISGPSHPIVTRATVCSTFQTGTTPTGVVVPVVDGVVTLDGKADVRSTADITLMTSWPVLTSDPLAPYGNEVYIERGVKYSDDLVEYVGFGYFRIQTTEQAPATPVTSPIRVTAVDRMQPIIEGRLLQPKQFLSGTTFGTIVNTLITDIYPSATIEWDDNTDISTLTRSIIVEEDRYGFLNEAITSRGKIWYWDHRGILVIKDVPPTDVVVFTVTHGKNGNLINMDRSLTRDFTYNAVVAIGEAGDSAAPARGVAVDDDAASPTYFFGPFGKVPQFFSSSFLENNSQCEIAAESILARERGIVYQVSFTSIVNPAQEPYDVIKLKYSHNEAERIHIADVLTIPLVVGGPMDATMREQRVGLV